MEYLTPTQYLIIDVLFRFRGATATQLAALVFGKQYTLSQEKSIYNFLRKLKKLKLVTSYRLQGTHSKGSIYYLTEKGYEVEKEWFNIMEDQKGDGWINVESPLFADIYYSTYKPPLIQTTHHLLLIDFFIEVRELKQVEIAYRLNLYASENYSTDEGNFRFRPDAEIKFPDGRSLTIEVDTGTESHEQFRKKFRIYKQYFDYLNTQKFETLPTGILIVVEKKLRNHGMKRRWANIVSAFFKEIGHYHDKINLIMTTIDSVQETLSFEENRIQFEIKVDKIVRELLTSNGYEFVNYTYKSGTFIQENAYSYAIKNGNFKVLFNAVCQTYETRIYSRYLKHYSIISGGPDQRDAVKELVYVGKGKSIFYCGEKPFLIERLPYDIFDFDDGFSENFHDLSKNALYHQLDNK